MDLDNEIIKIVKPKLKMSNNKILNKLIKLKKRKRAYHFYCNFFIKLVSEDQKVNMHLIY